MGSGQWWAVQGSIADLSYACAALHKWADFRVRSPCPSGTKPQPSTCTPTRTAAITHTRPQQLGLGASEWDFYQ